MSPNLAMNRGTLRLIQQRIGFSQLVEGIMMKLGQMGMQHNGGSWQRSLCLRQPKNYAICVPVVCATHTYERMLHDVLYRMDINICYVELTH